VAAPLSRWTDLHDPTVTSRSRKVLSLRTSGTQQMKWTQAVSKPVEARRIGKPGARRLRNVERDQRILRTCGWKQRQLDRKRFIRSRLIWPVMQQKMNSFLPGLRTSINIAGCDFLPADVFPSSPVWPMSTYPKSLCLANVILTV
jgi:hypothetical protein